MSKGAIIRERKLKTGYRSLYLDIYWQGKRWTETIKIAFKANDKNTRELVYLQAEVRKAVINERLLSGEYDTVDKNGAKILFSSYLKKLPTRAYHTTLYNYFVKNWPTIKLGDFTVKLIDDIEKDLLSKMTNNGARSYEIYMKSALEKAVKENLIPKNPFNKNAKSVLKSENKVMRYLELDELKKLQKTEIKFIVTKKAFLFSCYTGIRKSDIERLKFSDIDMTNKTMSLKMKKTGKILYLTLHDEAIKILKEMEAIKRNELVFAGFSDCENGNHLKQWAKDADIPPFTFHASRHTFAMMLLESSGNILLVKEALGHENIENTMVYAKILNSKKQKAVKELPSMS